MDHPLKYPSTPHWPWSETVHRDDSTHQRPENFVGPEVVITEKLDGGNTCLWRGDVYARSTTQPSHAGWMGMVRKHHAWKTQPFELMFYGEDLFGIHSIEYDPMPEDQTYRLFATRHYCTNFGERDVFHDWDTVLFYAETIKVPTVPVLFRGRFRSTDEITEFFREELKQPSSIGGEREGFVMRWADMFFASDFPNYVCKYVRANHVQTDEHWTRNWQPCKLI